MNLVRLDSNPHRKDDEWPDDHVQQSFVVEAVETYSIDESSIVRVPFNRFGKGQERRSDFAVDINWIDVAGLIRAFIRMGHPQAAHLQRVLELARSVDRAGWRSGDEPVEFWDYLS